jgi:hypothetical protein
MPIPKPKAEETEQEYISRCMSDEKMKEEYSPQQRYAVCASSYTINTQNSKDSRTKKHK